MNTGFKKITRFFESERSRLVAYVRRRMGEAAALDSEDIVQEVALNLFAMADVTAPIENLSAYVYQALRNRVVDAFRRRKNNISLEKNMNPENPQTLMDLLRDKSPGADSELEKREQVARIYAAMDALNEQEKAVIIETEFKERSFRDLAAAWRTPVGTLLSQKSRALEKIRKRLRENNIL